MTKAKTSPGGAVTPDSLMTCPALRVLFPLALCLVGLVTVQSVTSADEVPPFTVGDYEWSDLITFDSQQEYEACITTNDQEHDYGGSYPVERVADPEPNRPGALRLQNLRDLGATSLTLAQVVPARAMLTLSRPLDEYPRDDASHEPADEYPREGGPYEPVAVISVAFDYLFRSAGGAMTVTVRHGALEIRLPSVIAPDQGSPGGSGGLAWGRYKEQWAVSGHFDSGPRRITLELRGPAGTQVMIDELSAEAENLEVQDPAESLLLEESGAVEVVRCISHCADIAGIHYYSVGPEDYLAAVYSISGGALSCVDGEFTTDDVVSMEDVEYFDWAEAYPPIRSCGDGLAASASVQGTVGPLSALGCTPKAPLLIAGKAHAYDPYNDEHLFLADRIFGFDTDCEPVGEPLTWGEDRLNTRLANDHSGALYQLNVRKGIVRLSDGQSVLPRGCLPCEGNDVYVGWNRDKGAPPLQDLAFDDSGDVYVVPVLVAQPGEESYRAAARIRLGATAGDNRIIQLYIMPLFASGVHEIELDQAQQVFVLDKRHWKDSILLCYDRDSGRLEGSRECSGLLSGRMPSAFHVSRRDGRIFIVTENGSLLQLPSLLASYPDIKWTTTQGISFVTDATEEYDTGTIWLAGFRFESLPNAADVRNGATLFFEPGFKPVLAKIPRDSHGPIEAVAVSDYEIPGKEYLSLPLSIVCTGPGP